MNAFALIIHLLKTAPKEAGEDPDEFCIKNLCDYVINEKFIYILDSFIDYNNPQEGLYALRVFNEGLIYGELSIDESTYLVKIKFIDRLLNLLTIDPSDENNKIISITLRIVSNLAVTCSFLLKSLQNRQVLQKLTAILTNDSFDIDKEFMHIFITISNCGNQICEEFEYQVEKLVPHLGSKLYEYVQPTKEIALEFIDKHEGDERSPISICGQILWTFFTLTEKYEKFASFIVSQKYFLVAIIKGLYGEAESIHLPAMKILSNLIGKSFDKEMLYLEEQFTIISRLLEFVDKNNQDLTREACLFLQNFICIAKDTTLDNRARDFLPKVIGMLDDVSIGIRSDALYILNQLGQRNNSILIYSLNTLNLIPKIIGILERKSTSAEEVDDCLILLGGLFEQSKDTVNEFEEKEGVDILGELLHTQSEDTCRRIEQMLKIYYNFDCIEEVKIEETDFNDNFTCNEMG